MNHGEGRRRTLYPTGSMLGPDVTAEAASSFRMGYRGVRPAYGAEVTGLTSQAIAAVAEATRELYHLGHKGQQPWIPVTDMLHSLGLSGYLIRGERYPAIKAKVIEIARRRGVDPVTWRMGRFQIYLVGFSALPVHRVMHQVQSEGLLDPSKYGAQGEQEAPADVSWDVPGGKMSYSGDTIGLVAILGFLVWSGYREARMYARMNGGR